MAYFPFGETVTLLREHVDALGDITITEETTFFGVAWLPSQQGIGSTAETGGITEQKVTGRTLFLPPNSGVQPYHRVRFSDGSVWEVRGPAVTRKSFLTGWYAGDNCQLLYVRG